MNVQTSVELLGIPMTAGARVDIYSGVARLAGKVWASRHRSHAGPSGTAVVIVHPSSNFLGHYLLGPLAELGVDAIGLNTRYIGNDSALIMENCVLDVAAAVRLLREEGYQRIVLVGNSGGGGLVAMYQSQAESPTIRCTPAGDPPDLTRDPLPPVDAIVELMAHPGRALVYTEWLDPAIVEESQPLARAPELDMFAAHNGPPYTAEFLERYRAAQVARNRRITSWVRGQLPLLERSTGGAVSDLPFVVHGTVADPRFLDLAIDPSDRPTGTLWGDPYAANFSPATLGHLTSLRSWLSQWSVDESECDGPRHLARVSVPVLVVYGTGDNACFPSHARSLYDAVRHDDKELIAVPGAGHYFQGQPELMRQTAERILGWLRRHDMVR